VLLGISKRGDSYLRTLLIHGARSVIQASAKQTGANPWLKGVLERRPTNVAAVALANKNARIVWAMMAHDQEYAPLGAAA
jgi:transposase